ncbi:UDP-glucose 4-epimerase GalE [Lyngbya confervoides]|uniref:UDP-glucose 4-epimerase n=1 Tax=Lyngbya confervoides BDU141951 TaxID=1574623 RepID=A0ABD4T8P2_9CYAN|nr:UDP-glucose 4-epimerase GalE [Lyngbya confervoides]MCM1984680.1 UDP-glucose 4-epimerase GalE [Lyngbya confervoides BDU141951]
MASPPSHPSHILVTGGAGYIGSHAVLALTEAGYRVTALDNLATGFAEAVLAPAQLIVGDVSNAQLLDEIFTTHTFQGVMHFAASSVVPESVHHPLNYYRNNVAGTLNLLQAIQKYRVPYFILSSTAAVYGIPHTNPVVETTPLHPISPYGRTKIIDEWMLQDLAKSEPWFRYGILRYFNVAGGDPAGRLGQSTPKATHLIKLACQTALGLHPQLKIFGNDYPTPDGTGVRDFIHVSDLVAAHVLVLQSLEAGHPSDLFNCGYGRGYSVQEVIDAVKAVSQVDFSTQVTPRRPGDPPAVIAQVDKIKQKIGWQPQYEDLKEMITTAFRWEERLHRAQRP